MTINKIQPISQTNRTIIIDILRGWALFIVVTMNFLDFVGFNNLKDVKPTNLDFVFSIVESSLLNTKGWLLLAVLFGYGFAFLITKLEQKGKNVVSFFLWRMMWLFVIGILNSLIFEGDILLDYAMMGALLLVFYKMKTKTLWWIILIGFIICPFIDPIFFKHPVVFSNNLFTQTELLLKSPELKNVLLGNLLGRVNTLIFFLPYSITVHIMQFIFFILGLITYRYNFFIQVKDKYYSLVKKIFWTSLICFLVTTSISILFHYLLKNDVLFKYIGLRYISAVPGSLMFSAGIITLFVNNRCKKITDLMKYIGTMTLTNYLIQNIIMFVLFSIIKIDMESYWNFLLATTIYILQIFFSKWWLSKYNYGLIEWLWRSVSYRYWFPLKIN